MLSNMFNALGPSLAPQIRSSKTLSRWIKPFASWYVDLAGYRKVGLKYDDLGMCARNCLSLKPC